MNLAICDDHLTFIESLQTLLAGRGHNVVGWSTNPHDASALSPPGIDAIIVDLHFPGIAGSDAVGIIRGAVSLTPIVILTATSDPDVIEQAFEQGADGAVLKTEGIDELEAVLLKVGAVPAGSARADRDPKVRSRRVRSMAKRSQKRGPGPRLTNRELEVLEALAAGRTTAEIAQSMGVRISTVRTHVQHLLSKCGAHSRLALVAYAQRTKLAGSPSSLGKTP